MALIEMTFRSEALNSDQSMCIFLPEPKDVKLAEKGKLEEDLPVLYLLHGHTDNHTAWLRRSNMEAYLHKHRHNMICVCPAMYNFWYTDMVNGWDYGTFMTEELPAYIQTVFRGSTKREDNFIAGLSMGGYGAFSLAMKNPEKYAAAASFSGGMDVVNMVPDNITQGAMTDFEAKAVFGTDDLGEIKGTQFDLYQVVKDLAASGKQVPKLYLSCGTADSLYQGNIEIHIYLEDQGLACDYYEQEGAAHEWDFWDSEGKKLLDWLPVREG